MVLEVEEEAANGKAAGFVPPCGGKVCGGVVASVLVLVRLLGGGTKERKIKRMVSRELNSCAAAWWDS